MARSLAFLFCLLTFASSGTARAQRIEACDAPWLDTIRLRAVLRVELAQLDHGSGEGLTFVVAACTESEAEVRVEQAGRVLDRSVIELGDVPPNLRARLLALVLVELVRVSTPVPLAPSATPSPGPAEEAVVDDAVAAPETAQAAPDPEPTAAEAAFERARRRMPAYRDLDDEPPPFARRDTIEPDTDESGLVRRSLTLAFDGGVRWFTLQGTRTGSVRGQVRWKHLVSELRYTLGPFVGTSAEDDARFQSLEVGVGVAYPWVGRLFAHRVALVGALGFVRSSIEVTTGDPFRRSMGTPTLGASLSWGLATRIGSVNVLFRPELGWVRGARVERELLGPPGTGFIRTEQAGAMHGFVLGLTTGFELGHGVSG